MFKGVKEKLDLLDLLVNKDNPSAHYHEGLPITSGERYILVGFIE